MSTPIHDRIRKLLALAADASAGEADSAAAMAARLMAEHSITLADIAATQARERPSVGCRRIVVTTAMWESMLMAVVAGACGGTAIRSRRGNDVTMLVYAPEATIDSILDLATYLRLQVLREAAREAERLRPPRVRAWKRSFIVGAISRAGERLKAQRAEVAAASVRAGTALAVLDDAVERHVEKQHPRLSKTRRITVGAGYGDGREAGNRLDVGGAKIGGTTRARLQ